MKQLMHSNIYYNKPYIPHLIWLSLVILLGSAMPLKAETLKVVTSISLWEEVVKAVGGNHVVVTTLAPRGVNLHEFQLSPKDHVNLNHSDLVIALSPYYEAWLISALKKVPLEKQFILQNFLTQSMIKNDNEHQKKHAIHDKDKHEVRQTNHDHGDFDPHLWHDPKMMMQVVQLILKELSRKDGSHAQDYAHNAKQFHEKLLALDQNIKQSLAFIPQGRRVMATTHASFNYFGRAYAFEMLAIQGLNTQEMISPQRMQTIISEIKQHQAAALFVEFGVNPSSIQQLSRALKIHVSGELLSENLALLGQPGDSYESFMLNNVRAIVNAFQIGL